LGSSRYFISQTLLGVAKELIARRAVKTKRGEMK